jgi:hypothetical protein
MLGKLGFLNLKKTDFGGVLKKGQPIWNFTRIEESKKYWKLRESKLK